VESRTAAIDRRHEILTAARQVLAERGLEAATVSEIVSRAGVAQGTFYLYFPSKAALVPALAQQMREHVLQAAREAAGPKRSMPARIKAMVEAGLTEMGKFQDVLGILQAGLAVSGDAPDWEALSQPFYKVVEDEIRDGMARGAVTDEVDPAVCARLVVNLVGTAAEDCYLFSPPVGLDHYRRQLVGFVLRALAPLTR